MATPIPLAIIGMSCKFAGDATDPEKLWKMCAEGRTAWSRIPTSRFNVDGLYHPNGQKADTTNVIGGHFLEEDIALFDAGFFGFPSELAASLDPQFRLQLEQAYEAFESAGLSMRDVAGSNTAVYAGAFFQDYSDAHVRDTSTLPRSLLLGVGSAMASNRLSHFFDLRGPSMSIDTGCSTTLTAFHQACQSLRTGESDMALIGGGNVIFNPDNFLIMSSLSFLSPEGRSFAFDSRASGYGRGEGSATIIIKRLDDALRNGDPIRSVVVASGVNQDGKTETITSPSQDAQAALIRETYRKSGLDPSETSFFECHGTGTPTGDPLEIGALSSVFSATRTADKPLLIGSVKTNIGHTETASGLAALIKVTLALERGLIPPSCNFIQENPALRLAERNLKVPTQLEAWPEVNGIRRASVNNFGYGGTNAHVILESYESYVASQARKETTKALLAGTESLGAALTAAAGNVSSSSSDDGHTSVSLGNIDTGSNAGASENDSQTDVSLISIDVGDNAKAFPDKQTDVKVVEIPADGLVTPVSVEMANNELPSKVVMLSAKDEQAGLAMTAALKNYLDQVGTTADEKFFDNLVYTLGQRRTVLPWIAAAPARSVSDLIQQLDGPKFKPVKTSTSRPKIGFVFTGQGAQWWAMGRELIDACPVFKDTIVEADSILEELGSTWFLLDELMKDEQNSRVNEIALSTPMSCVVQIALIRLLKSWGISPRAVASHSSGEIGAAYAAGALSLKSAMTICFARGQLAGKPPPGAKKGGMVALGLSAEKSEEYIARLTAGEVVVACHNSPTSTTASGDAAAIDELEALCKKDNIFARRLRIDAAYHSHHMQPIADPYLAWLEKVIKPQETMDTEVIFASPTTGKREDSAAMISGANHWVDSLTKPVQFIQAFRNMCFEDKTSETSAVDIVIEIGPHAALSGPIQEIIATLKGSQIKYFSTLVRKMSAVDTMQALASDLLRGGCDLNIEAVNFPIRNDSLQVLPSLPHYQWTHTVRHWSEARVNKAYRSRADPPHDLLGNLVHGTNTMSPTWRSIIRLGDLPWIRDHVVQGNILFPGAGFICMAIEGMANLRRHEGKTVKKYHLRDIQVQQALVVPETDSGIEIQLSIQTTSEKAIDVQGWKIFQICSVTSENKWSEHCNGLIYTELASDTATTVNIMPPSQFDYWKHTDPSDVYSDMRATGINHGPIFRNMTEIRTRSRESMTDMKIADTTALMPYNLESSYVVHPTTLDTTFQSAYGAYIATPESGGKLLVPLVPRSIGSLTVDPALPKDAGHMLKAFCSVIRASSQGCTSNISLYDAAESATSTNPLLSLDGFVVESIGTPLGQSGVPYDDQKLSISEWTPALSFTTPETVKAKLTTPFDPAEGETVMDLRHASIHFISDALRQLDAADVAQLEWYHKRYLAWMKLQITLAGQDMLGPKSSDWVHDDAEVRAQLLEKVSKASVNGELLIQLGKHMLPILRHEITPLEVMMEDKLLHKYYVEGLGWDRSSRKVADLVGMIARERPRAKILEIGAGTGGGSRNILHALGSDDSATGPLAASYDFTDISSGFFEDAREKFKDWKSLIRYKKLDIEDSDLTKQGFEEGSYDLIVACQVLHATKNMNHTMTNVRKLLKPGGKLVLLETTHDPVDLLFCFGVLPGWWLSEEEERKYSPSLSISKWNDVLSGNGFTGVEAEIHDCDSEEFYSFSVMMSTALPSTGSNYDSDIAIVSDKQEAPSSWLSSLSNAISKTTCSLPAIETLNSLKADGKICIFIGDLTQSTLRDPTPEQFSAIRDMCTKSKGVFWLTRGGNVDSQSPDAAIIRGFFRTTRVEYVGKRMITLDLDPNTELWSTGSIENLAKIYARIFDYSTDNEVLDFEFAERAGQVHVQRYFHDTNRNKTLFVEPSNAFVADLEPLHQDGRPLRLTVGTPGLLDTLVFTDNADLETELPEDHIEITASAFGVNFRDVMVAMGQLQSDTMGFEVAGVVKQVGATAALCGFKPGDRVTSLIRRGHYSSHVRCEWTNAVHIPEDMSFETAATIPMIFATAYLGLFDMANLKKGESVLIHTAAGGVGQAAVLLAQHVGAEIFVTVGTEKKKELIMNRYGIPADHIFSSRDDSFASGIMAYTNGRGVDVVLNSLAGPMLQMSFDCVAQFGRFVELGKRDFEKNNSLALSRFTRNVSFSSLDLLQMEEHRGHDIQRVMRDVITLFQKKAVTAAEPVTVYPITELEKTFRLMQAGKHLGKIVVTVNNEDKVPVLRPSLAAKLRADASYLVVGGLGGLGKSICHWMVEHGARNIIVLSRSANQQKAQPFIDGMAKHNCKVKAVGCDISNVTALGSALEDCAKEMPPIRGVIQAAMVLQDSILEQMSINNYRAAVRPKVHGSWNLHQLLQSKDVDFFVMLSSLSGIVGFASQCNYAAGNTYQDALARHRTCMGLHGASIDIGAVKSVGYLAENKENLERLVKSNHRVLTEDDVLKAIESSIVSSPQGQIMLGLNDASLPLNDARFTALRIREAIDSNTGGSKTSSGGELSGLIELASTFEDAVQAVVESVMKKLADIFMIEEAEIAPSNSVTELGVDSLVAVELRNMLALRAGAEISIFDIMQSPSILELAATVATKSHYLDVSLLPSA